MLTLILIQLLTAYDTDTITDCNQNNLNTDECIQLNNFIMIPDICGITKNNAKEYESFSNSLSVSKTNESSSLLSLDEMVPSNNYNVTPIFIYDKNIPDNMVSSSPEILNNDNYLQVPILIIFPI